MIEPEWLDPGAIRAIHDEQLLEHGGARGVRDPGLLDSALARPRHQFAYGTADIFALAAAYGFGIVRNHPFIDGNKRTGFIAAVLFLELNGFRFGATEVDVVETILKLAAGDLPEQDLALWLKANSVPVAEDI